MNDDDVLASADVVAAKKRMAARYFWPESSRLAGVFAGRHCEKDEPDHDFIFAGNDR